MVGIVIVAHSQKLAEGVVELASMMAEKVPVIAAGGLEDGALGTSYDKIHDAIESVYSDDGVAVLADIGSSIMTAEIVLEDMNRSNVRLVDCPLVEGAILAAVESQGGRELEDLIEHVEEARGAKKFMC